jgi:predicted ATPase
MNKWHVITGGPSTGKTTTMEALAELGFTTLPEAARVVIDNGFEAGLTIEQIRADEKVFQDQVMMHKIAVEARLDPDVTTLMDRGMHDSKAYYELHDFEMAPWVTEALQKARYQTVFLLEQLPVYEQDYARTETPEEVAQLTNLLFNAYANYGMEPIWVPAMSIADRVGFIVEQINSKQ